MEQRGFAWPVIAVASAAVLVLSWVGYELGRWPAAPPDGITAQAAQPTPAAGAPLWRGARLLSDFTTMPDGAPRTDGPPFILNDGNSGEPGALPRVRDGALTIASDIGAGYAQQQPPWEPQRIGAEFRFGPGGDSGAICLAFWDRPIPEPYAVPDSPMHFVVTPTHWYYGIWEGGEFEQIAGEPLAEPLAQNGQTLYTTEVSVSGDTAHVVLPDGDAFTLTDPRIGALPNRVANWEVYLNDPGDAVAAFTKAWADPEPRTGAA